MDGWRGGRDEPGRGDGGMEGRTQGGAAERRSAVFHFEGLPAKAAPVEPGWAARGRVVRTGNDRRDAAGAGRGGERHLHERRQDQDHSERSPGDHAAGGGAHPGDSGRPGADSEKQDRARRQQPSGAVWQCKGAEWTADDGRARSAGDRGRVPARRYAEGQQRVHKKEPRQLHSKQRGFVCRSKKNHSASSPNWAYNSVPAASAKWFYW